MDERSAGDCGDCGKIDRGRLWSGTGCGHSSSCRTADCVEFPERDRLVNETPGDSTTISRRTDNDSGSGALFHNTGSDKEPLTRTDTHFST